ncbi:MgtC/SapB family protein [Planococcus halotolerans]|uniref:MgtC/SapB family protein n=1 Tax=Planococcus halotolerans TaxID=2233542 RepID=A0A365KMY7_9BACL|nr:MgtC/SapB family protein [Planococcus halotolerans]QHJ71782.1 MgtC/SapB family protein [Planococcus halotolerans]RAZ74543.1 MgtC/SapB family protein [Planococcus halotolerans]
MEFFSALQISSLETFLKLLIAAALSLVIGLERELKRKPVGLKTSVVISTFSCLLTIISIESAYIAQGSEYENVNITMDPLRLAAQIVSGIGFLGAGVILKRGNDSISGLTTAAMIWGAGGIGIAVAAGFYLEAALAVLIVLLSIELLPPLMTKLGPSRLRMAEATVRIFILERQYIKPVIEELKKSGITIEGISITHPNNEASTGSGYHELFIRVSYLQDKDTLDLYQDLYSINNVEQVDIEITN